MSEWKEVSLSELGKTITGKTPSSQYPEDFGDEVPFITPSDSFEKKYISKSERFLSRSGSERLKDKIISSDSIMVTCIGSAMGKVAKNSLPSVTNQQINSIIVNEKFDSDYIYYLFKNNYAVFRNAASGSTAIPILNKTDFDNLRFKVELDLNEQRKMVSILSKIDDKIEINNQINQELEAMAKTLYDYWFVQFDFPDQNGKPYKSSGGKMVYNPELKREIPEGWGVTKLNEVVDLISGYPFSSNDYVTSGKYKLYTIKNVQDGYTVDKVDNYLDFLPSNMSDECQLRRGDLIMSLTGNVGRVGMVYEDDVLLNQRVLKLNPINKTHKSFIYSFFRSDVTKAHLENMSTGTSQKNLSPIDIGNMMIPFPSESLLSKFLDNLNILENNFVENQQLTQLRDWLLPILMNGQVKVE